jgi:hypothetical protein
MSDGLEFFCSFLAYHIASGLTHRKDPKMSAASFAPITEEFDQKFARSLSPAARTLWSWLRRQAPPGREFEFCLDEFVEKFTYTLKWSRSALNALIDCGLVEVVRKYYSHGFKVIVHQVGDIGKKTSIPGDKTSQLGNETSQILPSNLHSSVNINREESFKENKTEQRSSHSTHPVPLTEKTTATPPEISLSPECEEFLQRAKDLGVQLNQNLLTLIQSHPPEVVRNALAALQEQMQSNNRIDSKEGFLSNAIRRRWRPNAERRVRRSLPATELPPAQQEVVAAEYQALGQSLGIEVIPAAIQPPLDDFSDVYMFIRHNVQRLGWDKPQVEASLQHRYGKTRRSLLSDAELLDWVDFLATCESTEAPLKIQG